MTEQIGWEPHVGWRVHSDRGAGFFDSEKDARIHACDLIKDGCNRVWINEEDEE